MAPPNELIFSNQQTYKLKKQCEKKGKVREDGVNEQKVFYFSQFQKLEFLSWGPNQICENKPNIF